MPNIAPLGLWGEPDGTGGAPSAVVDLVATLPGETTPRNALEVWCGDAAGVPRLVWARLADSPTSATATYVSGSPAANGKVTIAWVPQSPVRADSYLVKRADGSVVGTATQSAGSIDDLAPRPITGAYTVAGVLAGVADTSPTSTNSLSLGLTVATYVAELWPTPVSHPYLHWTQPTWGKPHEYQLFRDGALYVTLDGAALSYDDLGHNPGAAQIYEVFPVLAGVAGTGSGATALATVPLAPISVSLSSPGYDLIRLNFYYPGGSIARYEVQRYDDAAPGWVNHDLSNLSGVSDWSTTTWSGYMRVRSIGTDGVASPYVQVGAIPAQVPAPTNITIAHHPTDWPNSIRVISDFMGSGVPAWAFTMCGEFYGNPSFGWRTDFTTGMGGGLACQLRTVTTGESLIWDATRAGGWGTYFRARNVRHGVYSDYTQVGPM